MKIPKQAKSVFEGVIYDVYQWEQPLFDGSSATFEMLKRPNTLQVIPIHDNKILIAKETQPIKGEFYSLLGGRQEPAEEPLAGAKREFLEETGMTAQIWKPYATYEPVTKIEWSVYIFLAYGLEKVQAQQLDPGEDVTVEAVDFDTFIDIVMSDQFWGRELQRELLLMYYKEQHFEKVQRTFFQTVQTKNMP